MHGPAFSSDGSAVALYAALIILPVIWIASTAFKRQIDILMARIAFETDARQHREASLHRLARFLVELLEQRRRRHLLPRRWSCSSRALAAYALSGGAAAALARAWAPRPLPAVQHDPADHFRRVVVLALPRCGLYGQHLDRPRHRQCGDAASLSLSGFRRRLRARCRGNCSMRRRSTAARHRSGSGSSFSPRQERARRPRPSLSSCSSGTTSRLH